MSVPVVIGGADGPTSIFFAGKLGGGWINVMGLGIVIAILLPNILYAVKFRNIENKCTNKFMNVAEQIGRYGCMIFMMFHIGKTEFGFGSLNAFLVYLIGSAFLLLGYWLVWILYFMKQTKWKNIALAVIPTLIFFLSGVTLQHIPLLMTALLFGVGHLYVTWKNID